ncbi:MAG: hypothetical protein ACLUHA_02535 [Bacteroides stercoris]
MGISMPQALKQKAIEFDDNNMTIEPWDATVNDTELAEIRPSLKLSVIRTCSEEWPITSTTAFAVQPDKMKI